MKRFFSLIIILQLSSLILHAAPDTLSVKEHGTILIDSKHISILEDTSGNRTFNDVLKITEIPPVKGRVPNKGISLSTFWLRFSVTNATARPDLMIYVHNSQLNHVDLY